MQGTLTVDCRLNIQIKGPRTTSALADTPQPSVHKTSALIDKGECVIVRAPDGYWIGKLLTSVMVDTTTVRTSCCHDIHTSANNILRYLFQAMVAWYDEIEPDVFIETKDRDRIDVHSIHPEAVTLIVIAPQRYKLKIDHKVATCLKEYKLQAMIAKKKRAK